MQRNSPRRLIDRLPAYDGDNVMKVLVLGAPRTGTTSIGIALKMLGYNAYTGMGHSFFNENRFPHWSEAIDAKYFGKGTPFGTAEFNKILGDYEAVMSWPAVLFVDELLSAYPDAKVILTNRDVDAWLESMDNTICKVQSWRSYHLLMPLERGRIRDFRQCADRCGEVWGCGPGERDRLRQYYSDHYEHVRVVVPKHRVLEFRSADGWEPLCRFLGKEVPKEPYPRAQDTAQFVGTMRRIWWFCLGKATINVSICVGFVIAGVVWSGILSSLVSSISADVGSKIGEL